MNFQRIVEGIGTHAVFPTLVPLAQSWETRPLVTTLINIGTPWIITHNVVLWPTMGETKMSSHVIMFSCWNLDSVVLNSVVSRLMQAFKKMFGLFCTAFVYIPKHFVCVCVCLGDVVLCYYIFYLSRVNIHTSGGVLSLYGGKEIIY